MRKYTLKTYTKINKNLKREWETIWKKSPHAELTNSPSWVADQVQKNIIKKLRIVCVFEEDQIVAILPLESTYHVGVESWVSIGRRQSEKSTLLIDGQNKNIFREIAHYIKSENNNVVIDKIPELYASLIKGYLSAATLMTTRLSQERVKSSGRGRKRNTRPALLYTASPTTKWWWNKAKNITWLTP